MREVGMLEAKTGLSALVADVQRTGEEIVLTRHGRPAAKIVPIPSETAAVQHDPVEWQKRVARIFAARDAQLFVPGFDDLPWDELKRLMRDEDSYD